MSSDKGVAPAVWSKSDRLHCSTAPRLPVCEWASPRVCVCVSVCAQSEVGMSVNTCPSGAEKRNLIHI